MRGAEAGTPRLGRGLGDLLLCAAVRLIGSRSSTIVPIPGVERMRIAPWCNSVSDFAIASPKPEP